MNKYHFLSLICFIISIILFILGFLHGELQTGIFLIFPFISGSGVYAFTGFILIFIAMLLFVFGFSTDYKSYELSDESKINQKESQPTKKMSFKGGGVVLIGPIPIVFGSNWKIAMLLMILTIILILIAFLTIKYL